MSPFNLFALPTELTLMILNQLAASDLVAFSITSTLSQTLANPILKSLPAETITADYKRATETNNHRAILSLIPLVLQQQETNPSPLTEYYALMWACQSSCAKAVRKLTTSARPDIPRQWPEWPLAPSTLSPFLCALKNSNPAVLEALLDAGVSLGVIAFFTFESGPRYNPPDSDLFYLHHAAIGGFIGLVNYLLARGREFNVDVDRSDHVGSTALILAAERGHVEIVAALLIHNANVHLVDSGGRTALAWALVGKYWDVVRMLLNYGA